eukprot:scaffold28477_cov112-Isochrysis_galbana.AAC.7
MLQHAAAAKLVAAQAHRETVHLPTQPALHNQLRMAQQKQALLQHEQREALAAHQARLRQQQGAAGAAPLTSGPPGGMGGAAIPPTNFLMELEEHLRMSRDGAAPGLAPSPSREGLP